MDTFNINNDPRVIGRTEGRIDPARQKRLITKEYSDETGEPFHNELQALCEKYGVNAMMFFGIRHMKVGERMATDFLGDQTGLSYEQGRVYDQCKKIFRDLEDQAYHTVPGLLRSDGTIINEERLLNFIRGTGEFRHP